MPFLEEHAHDHIYTMTQNVYIVFLNLFVTFID